MNKRMKRKTALEKLLQQSSDLKKKKKKKTLTFLNTVVNCIRTIEILQFPQGLLAKHVIIERKSRPNKMPNLHTARHSPREQSP